MIDGLTLRHKDWLVSGAASFYPTRSLAKPRKAARVSELFCCARFSSSQSLVVAVLCSIVLHGGVLAFCQVMASSPAGGGGLLPGPVSVSLRSLPVVSDSVLSAGKEVSPVAAVYAPPVDEPAVELTHQAVAGSELTDRGSATENVNVESVAEAPASSGMRYYRGSELTQRPRPLAQVDLSDPALSDPADVARSGSIMLRLLIDDTGKVDQVLVEASDLPDIFQELAIRRFSQTRFSPGMIQDQAVRSQMRLEVTFQATP